MLEETPEEREVFSAMEHNSVRKEIIRTTREEKISKPGVYEKPVAWWIPKAEQFCLPSSDGTRPFAKAWEPLYTTLPQRTWVGLPESAFAGMTLQQVTAMKYAEQILKDQNT